MGYNLCFIVFCVGQMLAQGNGEPILITAGYDELRVGTVPDKVQWGGLSEGLHASWASRDVHYSLHNVPDIKEKVDTVITVWKGERANMEAVLFSKTNQGKLTLRFSNIPAWAGTDGKISAWYMNYVITDDYKDCGTHDMSRQKWLVPDIISRDMEYDVTAMETRPIWCSIQVPHDIKAGHYTTTLEIVNAEDKVVESLNLTINVDSHSLPAVSNQKFHLDLWQQPYAVSRYYGLERWSNAHIEALRPYLKALGDAGQKVVSTILFYEPWGDQSFDKFSAMVQTTKKADGTWSYDYTIFDRYVELCAEYGITSQINCYSMVPWGMTFRYFDETVGHDMDLKTKTSGDDYKILWTNFLTHFKAHLLEKGWFGKTCLAMDERSESDMLNAYSIAESLGFRMTLAGNYHSSLINKLQDYCLAPSQLRYYTMADRAYRKQNHLTTTIYTSCAESEPNILSNSLPAEAAFLPLFTAANDLDGYLHWSWINWDENPLTDTRYRLFGSGDTYFYYPENRSSIRFERLIEGIHQFEKVQILKNEYKNDATKLYKLNRLLDLFRDFNISGNECAERVNLMEKFLNGGEVTLPESAPDTLFSTLKGGMDIPPYRIPGISCGKGGHLIATAARLVGGTDPGYGQVDVVCRLSKDNGRTWSEIKDVAVGNSALINNVKTPMEASYGDPAVVYDRTSDEVLVMAVGGCTVYTHPATNRQNPNIIAAIRSLDGGNTWQTPENQTEQIYGLFDSGRPVEAAFVGGGRLFQSRIVKTGRYYRLYAALAARPGGNRVVYSDDFGHTWKVLGGNKSLPVPDGDEPKCEELPDGRVVITSRTASGRWFNIFDYTDMEVGEGLWETSTKCTFDGLCAVPSSSPTNGELLIVPVIRSSDGCSVHLALQSMPTGSGRANVGIFYKELADDTDMRTVAEFASHWDGFYQVSNTSSAYSSLDLQTDGKIGFFYEETLTKWGARANPVSTSFPAGSGTHNFDGFENIYLPLDISLITDGSYRIDCKKIAKMGD